MYDRLMKKADEIIHNFLSSSTISKNELSIFRDWPSIVGKDLAEISKPVDITENTMIIHTTHPAAAQSIRMKEREIVRNIAKTYEILKIRKIQIKVVDKLLKDLNPDRSKPTKNGNLRDKIDKKDSFPQRSFKEILVEFRKRAETE